MCILVILLGVNVSGMPKKYIKVTYAVADYIPNAKDPNANAQLRLTKGQKVYEVLHTTNGWCVGMAGGQWGLFKDSAVSSGHHLEGELRNH